jgi:hypothetical protein
MLKLSILRKLRKSALVSYIYIGPERLGGGQLGETSVQIDDGLIEEMGEIRNIMYDKLMEEPRLIVSLRVDQDSEFGIITDVQQELRHAGTLRINYSTRRQL